MANRYSQMWPEYDHTSSGWRVYRVAADGHTSATPWTYKTKWSALHYIQAHGLSPEYPY